MANKDSLRISVVTDGLKVHTNAVLNAIDAAADYAVKLTDAQDGATVLAWSRILYWVADTGNVTLSVDATAKTITHTDNAGTAISGSTMFSNFRVGRDVQITNFTNAGNNQTTEITAVSNGSITIGNATGLVNETADTNARVQENTTAEEQAVVTAITSVRSRFTELQDALDNTAVGTADRRGDLMDWIW